LVAILAAMLALGGGAYARTQPQRPAYQPLRYDEDYTFLSDPAQRTDFWDVVKYIPIARGRAGFLSLGGEARVRFETYRNEFFSTSPHADNAYLLQRYFLHADYHPTDWLRIFGQFQSSLEDGRPGGPRPTDRDTFDIHQLFADLTAKIGDERLTLRIGRQEMSYGAERLISPREGTNNRRSFNAARLLFARDSVSIDAFFSSPVEVDQDVFDNQNIRDLWLWGVYATVPFPRLAGIKLDLYYLGLSNPDATFASGTGREERQTIGTRFFGTIGRWDFNHEAIYQFGHFSAGDIAAWSVATEQGYTIENWWGKPRLALRAAISSGDRNAASPNLQTFNPLFPRGDYYTQAAMLGPQNFINLLPYLHFEPFPEWSIDTGCDFLWRQSLNDGIYTPGGSVIFPGNADFGRFVGMDVSLIISWQATRHLKLSATYTHFFAGAFVHQNGGEDVDYGAVWVTYKF
jgi:hypothetical protein